MTGTGIEKRTNANRERPKHPGGAPKKKIRKDRSIRVRLSATEHFLAQTKANSAGMKISDWVRSAIRNTKVVPRWSAKEQELFRMLRGMANNLNQFARAANSGGLLTVARRCMELLEQVNKTIDHLYQDDSEDT